jgi:histidinol-phosphate aminotransferase
MSVRIRREIAELAPYRQGRPAPAGAYKLSSNENPFVPVHQIVAAAVTREINRYPDASAMDLRSRIAERFSVDVGRVHVAAGSVAILQQLLSAVAGPGDEVLFAWRSFEAYPGLITVTGASQVRVPLTNEGRHDIAAMADAITDRTRAVLVCSPNNPTGPVVTATEFEGLLLAAPDDVLIILDEAYREFVTSPAAHGEDYLSDPRVVSLRTFSKAYGLAGLRVGYALGAEEVMDAARASALPVSVTAGAQAAAIATLAHEDIIAGQVAELVERRAWLSLGLRDQGWEIPAAEGNFIWLPVGDLTRAAAEILERHGAIGRVFPDEGIRITIGEPQSIRAVLTACQNIRDQLLPSLSAPA